MALPLRSRCSNVSKPAKAFLVIDRIRFPWRISCLNLSSPENAPLMSSMVHEISLFLRSKVFKLVSPDGFVCDDFPKPQITVQPETQSAIKGSDVSFTCSAASSSDSPMTFAWKKDNEALQDAEMENYAHLRAQGGELMEYTTILRLRNVEFTSEGKYQCVISNHFGSSYSVKAKLTINSE